MDVVSEAAAREPAVRAALERYLGERRDVYADPRAFRRFIDGGGNVALYREAAQALGDLGAQWRPRRVVDLGCGDGRLTSAIVGPDAEQVDLVEPSAELLRLAEARIRGTGPEVVGRAMTAEQFVEATTGETWDLVVSTFALHALEPTARRHVLQALAGRAERIAVIEFDVPAFEDRSPEHAAYAVERYAAGIAEYADDDLVIQGFLMPVLVGQFDPAQPRHTWEQPLATWHADLEDAGFHDVKHRHVDDYWWAPAHLIHAAGRSPD